MMGGPKPLHHIARRFFLMLGGEVTQSVFHLLVSLALVRALPAVEYGVFALVFLAGGISLTFVRALAGIPAATIIPQAGSTRRKAALSVTFGSSATLFATAVACLVGALLARDGSLAVAFAGAAFVGFWTLRAYLRVQLFARGFPGIASAGDIAFAVSGAALLAPILLHPRSLLAGALTVLAVAHLIGILTALVALREPVRFSIRHSARSRYRALWPSLRWSIADVVLWNVQAQSYALLIAFVAGPAAYAPIAATLLLFSPLRLSAAVVVNMMQPEMAASLRRPGRLNRIQMLGGGALLAISTLYGIGLWLCLPAIDTHIFDQRFPDAPLQLIAGLIWIATTLSFLGAPARTLLETRHEFRTLAKLTGASATTGLAVTAAILAIADPPWSLFGLIAAEGVIIAGVLSIAVRDAMRRRRSAPTGLILEGAPSS